MTIIDLPIYHVWMKFLRFMYSIYLLFMSKKPKRESEVKSDREWNLYRLQEQFGTCKTRAETPLIERPRTTSTILMDARRDWCSVRCRVSWISNLKSNLACPWRRRTRTVACDAHRMFLYFASLVVAEKEVKLNESLLKTISFFVPLQF